MDLAGLQLGSVTQISFAVHDVNEAVDRYRVLFGGEFVTFDVQGNEVVVDGESSSTDLRLAFGKSGDVEIELVEVLAGAWPTVGWLEQHGEGLHHLQFRVADVASKRAELEARGFNVEMYSADGSSYVYLSSAMLPGLSIELLAA